MFDEKLRIQLDKRKQDSLYRTRIPREEQLAHPEILSFCSNDYLGLSNDARLKSTLKNAVDDMGVGSGSSPFLIGYSVAQQTLEKAIAEFLNVEKALVFSNGYMANLSIMSGLCGRDDTVFLDKLSHASLIDGVKLSGATLIRYQHADIAHLEEQLKSSRGRKMVVTEGVFSMDGTIADIQAVVQVAKRYDACLIIDDAHGFGVLGKNGRGVLSHCGVDAADVDAVMGTFGKAGGIIGAFVAGRKIIIEALEQFSRPLMYNTALPPALWQTANESLKILQQSDDLRKHLMLLIASFQQHAKAAGLTILPSLTPIQVVMVGEADVAEKCGIKLSEQGLRVSVIRPPTVPPHTSRLRISLTAKHSVDDVKRLIEALLAIKEKNNVAG